jgi:hypothetical protein
MEVHMINQHMTITRLAAFMMFFTCLCASFSVNAQSGNVVLWNKLGSDTEIRNSEIGPNGLITQGNIPITYSPLKFGNGMRTYGTYYEGFQQTTKVKFLFNAPNSLGDKGAVAFWVRPDHGSDDGGIRRWLNMTEGQIGAGIYWRGWDQGLMYELCTPSGCQQQILVPNSQVQFKAGDSLHVAFVWDLSGIDGTGNTLRAYFNGKLVGSSSRQWAHGLSMGGFSAGWSDYSQYASIDNLIVWDYAKTDFSDRFTENPIGCGEGDSAELSAIITKKSGVQSSRFWTITLSNKSGCPAENAQIDSMFLTQTAGAACTPMITSPLSFPLGVGNVPSNSQASGTVSIDFTGCPNNARFRADIDYSSNNGAVSGSKTLNNQFR